jgi:hypothetical protein
MCALRRQTPCQRQRGAPHWRCQPTAILENPLRKYLIVLLAAVAAASAAPAWSAVDVGVGITINQPGVYGRIEIGNQPPPPVLYAQPMIIAQPAVVVQQPPLYLYVPPGHAKHWARYCGRYNACGRQVYFVQEKWVKERYEEHRGEGRHDGHGEGHGKGHGKGNKHDD